jgi:hypothetical protein
VSTGLEAVGEKGKVASLVQQIASKQSAAAENVAAVAKLEASLPIPQQKRDLYRALVGVQFSNKLAWLDSEQAYSDQAALLRQLEQTRAGYAHDVLKDLAEAEEAPNTAGRAGPIGKPPRILMSIWLTEVAAKRISTLPGSMTGFGMSVRAKLSGPP